MTDARLSGQWPTRAMLDVSSRLVGGTTLEGGLYT